MKGIRLVAFVLVMLFVVGSGIAFAEQDDGSAPTLSPAPAPELGPEVASERTATSRTFRLSDGALRKQIFETPINYETSNGNWKPIEEGLQTQADGSGVTNGANAFDISLPEKVGAGPARLSFGEEWISARLLGETSDPVQLEDGQATYSAADPGTSFDFTAIANGLKEDIELADPSQTRIFHFEIDASSGLSPVLAKDGSIEFRAEDQKVVSVLPAPLLLDSTPEQPKVSADAHYALEPRSAGGWELTVDANSDWMQRPDLTWPIHIDPSLTLESPSLDCTFGGTKTPGTPVGAFESSNGWGLCGTGGQKQLYNYYRRSGSTDEWARSLLRFDLKALNGIGKRPYILDAKVKLNAPSAATNTSGVELRRATKLWESGGLSWNKHGGLPNGPWTLIGGDYTTDGTEILTKDRGAQAGWWEFSGAGLTSLVQNWLTNSVLYPQQGFVLKLLDDAKVECNPSCKERSLTFDSSAAVDASKRPRMEVTYYEKAPSTSKLTSPPDGTQSARRFKLKARWESGVTGVRFQYRIGDKGSFQTIPSEFVKDAEGKAVTWPIAVSGVEESPPVYLDATALEPKFKAEEGRLQVRALFDGGEGFAGYGTPNSITVNPDLGGPGDTATGIGPGSVDLLTGNYTVSRTDFRLPGSIGGVGISRTYSSRDSGSNGDTTVLGRGWKPTSMVESANGASWRSVREVPPTSEEAEEGLSGYAVLTDLNGVAISFEKEGETFIPPPEMDTWTLVKGSNIFALTDSDGNKTVFSNNGSGTEYLPISITQTGSGDNSAKYVYDLVNGRRRLKRLVAAGGLMSCSEISTFQLGCRALEFSYQPATTWGAPAADGDRLSSITYWGPESASAQGHWEVAKYKYDSAGRLIEEWDPRISSSCASEGKGCLKETYAYAKEAASEGGGLLKTLTPPGQEPWIFEYKALPGEKTEAGRLKAVTRPSLVASPATAQTTIAYEVPLSGGNGAPNMSKSEIAKWGQEDLPVDATAIFPPSEVPSSPPSSYAQAEIFYMDPEGGTVNTASPAAPGASGPSISTTETDEFGNVVRELSPQNRLRALEAGAGSIAKSHEIDFKFKYSKDGTDLQEEWGPLHQVRIKETGAMASARMHTIFQYDKGWNGTGIKPHLVTNETTGASVEKKGIDADQLVTETNYDWTLREPIERTVDPGGKNLKTVTAYNEVTGMVKERRTPAATNPLGDPHTTRIYYYGEAQAPSACKITAFTGLPCEIGPTAQPGGSLPEMLVTKFKAYNSLAQATEIVESPGGKEVSSRKTLSTYDAVGRLTGKAVTGGGTELSPTAIVYSKETGLPVEQKLTCEVKCEGFDSQASVGEYDKLGRPVKYTDADGNTASTTYDLDGRVSTTSDGKGSQVYGYDPSSGLVTVLEDSSAGIFTAAYDADGNMTAEGLPNGIVGQTSYDETGQPIALSYTKTGCPEKCTWFEENRKSSIYGQVLSDQSTLGTREYDYDKVGRLTLASETPQGGACTTRQYTYDAASNRTSLITRGPSGVCDTTSEATPQEYTYDKADRLTAGAEITYDSFGRITSLPGKYAGGGALSTTFFSNNMVASQTQSGVTNAYQLDALGRQRQRIQTGGVKGTEIFHYDGSSDSVSWTEREGTWTRNIIGIGGNLIGIQNNTATTLQLTDLHGDIVARAGTGKGITGFAKTFQYDEFGNPGQAETPRYGWLGGNSRRTELQSGVIQMGVRGYVPTLGRFLSPDPIEGGSANSYDYSNADPVNSSDPSGKKPWDISHTVPCVGDLHVYSPKIRKTAGNRGGYGKFYVKYRINCETPTYKVWVLKIIRTFQIVGGAIITYDPNVPSNPGADIWSEHWGNWNHPLMYQCLNGVEYEYKYEVVMKWATWLGIINDGKNAVGDNGEGTLRLSAQEFCGHGPY